MAGKGSGRASGRGLGGPGVGQWGAWGVLGEVLEALGSVLRRSKRVVALLWALHRKYQKSLGFSIVVEGFWVS